MDAAVAAEKTVAPVRRRVSRWLIASVLVAAAIMCVVMTRRPRQLMDHARLVTPYQVPADEILFGHRWMADGRLRVLLVHQFARGARAVDIDPGRGTVMASHEFPEATNAVWLSPDASRVLALTGFGTGRLKRTVYSVDGSKQATAATSAMPTGPTLWHWKPDSRSYIETDLKGGTQVAEYDISGGSPTLYKLQAPKPTSPLWIDSQNRLVVRRYKGPKGLPPRFEEISLGPNPVTRPLEIAAPPGYRLSFETLSPDERHVAWHLTFDDSSTDWWRRLTDRLFRRRTTTGPSEWEEVWISDSDGGNMHQLGELRAADGKRHIRDVQWTRDGSELTFFYDNRLYAVAVDR